MKKGDSDLILYAGIGLAAYLLLFKKTTAPVAATTYVPGTTVPVTATSANTNNLLSSAPGLLKTIENLFGGSSTTTVNTPVLQADQGTLDIQPDTYTASNGTVWNNASDYTNYVDSYNPVSNTYSDPEGLVDDPFSTLSQDIISGTY